MNNKVLIVDDERAIVDILKYNLEKNGMTAICAYDGGEGLRLARESDPDVILLDVMLPVMDGFEVCRTLRAEGNNVPIIMITAVVARVRTNMRRAASMAPQSAPEPSGDQLRAKDLVIDKARHAVFKDGKEIKLTQREYERMLYLAENPGKVISREELMSSVWQYDYYGDLRAVDVAIRRLREKLEPNPSEPEYVMTKRGAGYYFAD